MQFDVNDVVILVSMPRYAGALRMLIGRTFVVTAHETSPAGMEIYTIRPIFPPSTQEYVSMGRAPDHAGLLLRVRVTDLQGMQAAYVDISDDV